MTEQKKKPLKLYPTKYPGKGLPERGPWKSNPIRCEQGLIKWWWRAKGFYRSDKTLVHHYRTLSELIWPNFEWNPWTQWTFDHATAKSDIDLTLSGCAAAAKTTNAVRFAMLWWMSAHDCSTVLLTSTTAKMVRMRAWKEVRSAFYANPGFEASFNMVDSKTTLQNVKGDDLNAIKAIAVGEGETAKAMANIQGIHNKRIMVIIDEATHTPEAIVRACENLKKGCIEFCIIRIGNPDSELDPHGQACEPAAGWDSITVDDTEWETKSGGTCLHFDGLKSPNIGFDPPPYPYLFTEKDLRDAEKDGDDTPEFWKYTRGFWAPEGITKTVFTSRLINQYEMTGRFTFQSKNIPIAALDPAFEGGDERVMRFGEVGDIDESGKWGVQLTDKLKIKVKLSLDRTIHYQIADTVIEECTKRGIKPEHFALDTTGEGGGLASIIEEEWKARVHHVEFGGKASDRHVSATNPTPAKDRYKNKVTELWFSVRELGKHGQIKGIDLEESRQFCSRYYEEKGRLIQVEPKKLMKERTRQSPDSADAVAVLVDLFRERGWAGGNAIALRQDKKWLAIAREKHDILNDVSEAAAV